MNRKRSGLLALFGVALFLIAVEPAAAQSTSSTVTEELIWGLNNQLIYVAVPITILVEGILIYTVWKYRNNDDPKPTQENRRLEITWTIATAIILLFVGVASYQVLGNPYISAGAQAEVQEPDQMEEIKVIAQKYNFNFEYEGVNASGVSGTGLTLENVTVQGATVSNVTESGVKIRDAEVSGDKIESGTLANGTVTGVGNDTEPGDTVEYTDVTVESASLEDATISNATVSATRTMVMPNGTDVALNITSRDWLHAVHVPTMGLKQDAFPGEWNEIKTRPTETGNHQLYCAEYCGQGHSQMLGSVEVVPEEEYDDWLVEQWLSAQS